MAVLELWMLWEVAAGEQLSVLLLTRACAELRHLRSRLGAGALCSQRKVLTQVRSCLLCCSCWQSRDAPGLGARQPGERSQGRVHRAGWALQLHAAALVALSRVNSTALLCQLLPLLYILNVCPAPGAAQSQTGEQGKGSCPGAASAEPSALHPKESKMKAVNY